MTDRRRKLEDPRIFTAVLWIIAGEIIAGIIWWLL